MKKPLILALALGIVSVAGLAQASMITEWDQSGVTPAAPTNITNPGLTFDAYNYVFPGSLIDPITFDVAADGFMPSGWVKYGVGSGTFTNGAMTWKERDTQGPGLSIVNNDDVTGDNCIMSAGWNPDSTPDATQASDWWGVDLKQCSDPWQSSKRFKMVSYVVDGPADLTFKLDGSGQTDLYRILMKYGNHTGSRLTGFTMKLGFKDANGNFSEAAPGDGLAFALKNGTNHSNDAPTPSSMANQGDLDALMAHGLFGAPDKHHTSAGYFNPYVRANFGLLAGETFINTTGLAQVHRDLFGEWLPGDQMKGAMYFDDDGIIYTDNILMANCPGNFDEEAGQTGVATAECDQACADNLGCDAGWITYRESADVVDNGDGTYTIPPSVGTDVRAPIPVTAEQLAAWKADPNWAPGDIDDLANVNINAYLNISSTASSFTIRVTPTYDAAAAQAEPGTTSADQFVVSVDAPSTVIP
ncbi:MAG: choice-of-anchor F family protein [Thermodesulfobacteriota bacterium]